MSARRPPPLFACRRDRQRIALRRAHGLEVAEIAAIERATPGEIGDILRNRDMARLVAAHERFVALPHDGRLAELQAVALDLLQLRLLAGDVRAALFFAREMRAGRDPSRTLAEAVIAAAERKALRIGARAPDATDLRLDPMPGAAPQPAEPAAAVAAATDLETARAEAAAEAERFEARLASARRRLARAVQNEAERLATAAAAAAEDDADALHAKHGAARRRAREAERRQRIEALPSYRVIAGAELREAAAVRRFAERSCIELRLALLRVPGLKESLATEAARRLSTWALAPPRG